MKPYIYLSFVLLACNNKTHDEIKKEIIKKEIDTFVNSARTNLSKLEGKDTVLLNFKKTGSFYKVEFHYKSPTTFENLCGVIENKNQIIFVFSKKDNLKSFFNFAHPFAVDTLLYKTNQVQSTEIDWYSDFMYFDGLKFKRDTLNMQKL